MKKASECPQKKQWEIIVEKWKQQQNDKDKRGQSFGNSNCERRNQILTLYTNSKH